MRDGAAASVPLDLEPCFADFALAILFKVSFGVELPRDEVRAQAAAKHIIELCSTAAVHRLTLLTRPAALGAHWQLMLMFAAQSQQVQPDRARESTAHHEDQHINSVPHYLFTAPANAAIALQALHAALARAFSASLLSAAFTSPWTILSLMLPPPLKPRIAALAAALDPDARRVNSSMDIVYGAMQQLAEAYLKRHPEIRYGRDMEVLRSGSSLRPLPEGSVPDEGSVVASLLHAVDACAFQLV